jgi:hypothetical protein
MILRLLCIWLVFYSLLILHVTCLLYAQAQNCTTYALPCLESFIYKATEYRCAGLCFCADYTSTLLTQTQDEGPRGRVQSSSLILIYAGLGSGGRRRQRGVRLVPLYGTRCH